MPRRYRKSLEGKYEPFDEILPGDVIRWNGRLRKVRKVNHYADDRIYSIHFAKLRRSGYPSPATIYFRTEIRNSFGGIVFKGASLCTTAVECAMQKQIEAPFVPGDQLRALAVKESDTVGLVY